MIGSERKSPSMATPHRLHYEKETLNLKALVFSPFKSGDKNDEDSSTSTTKPDTKENIPMNFGTTDTSVINKRQDLPSWKAKHDQWFNAPCSKLQPFPRLAFLNKVDMASSLQQTFRTTIPTSHSKFSCSPKPAEARRGDVTYPVSFPSFPTTSTASTLKGASKRLYDGGNSFGSSSTSITSDKTEGDLLFEISDVSSSSSFKTSSEDATNWAMAVKASDLLRLLQLPSR